MKIYLAPMEGITGEVYRRAYHTFFEPMDKYFTPFLNPNPKGKFSRQEWNEIIPENNEGMYTVPQILTNHAPPKQSSTGKGDPVFCFIPMN